MPGVTFFRVFVRLETNRQEGGNPPPLVGRGLNPSLQFSKSWRESKFIHMDWDCSVYTLRRECANY